MTKYNIAVLGATGAVGRRIIKILEETSIPINHLKLLASARSAGTTLTFKGQEVTVEEATPDSFADVALVLSSAGGNVSKRLLPEAVKRGAVCIDNTSAFRMEEDVPLVVPEVNAAALKEHHGIIANPNCSTIQMVLCLEPIRRQFGLNRVIVSTYQAVSGAGQSAIKELQAENAALVNAVSQPTPTILPTAADRNHYQIAGNLLPQIDVFEADGYSHEEWKMIHETKKIMLGDMDAPELKVTATCVRVPVEIGHGESVYFEVADQTATSADIRALLNNAPGIVVEDDPSTQLYPQPLTAAGRKETFVGRIRPDLETHGAFNMWIVADNLLKGAAWNTVQIAEKLVTQELI